MALWANDPSGRYVFTEVGFQLVLTWRPSCYRSRIAESVASRKQKDATAVLAAGSRGPVISQSNLGRMPDRPALQL